MKRWFKFLWFDLEIRYLVAFLLVGLLIQWGWPTLDGWPKLFVGCFLAWWVLEGFRRLHL